MGIFRALSDSIGGTFSDQWKDILVPAGFDEQTLVSPGVLKASRNGRGSNLNGSDGIISNGSKIFIPENTAAFVFSQSGIENIIAEPGGYTYEDGQDSVFNGDGIKSSIIDQAKERFGYGGISSDYKKIAYVNLREIRNIKFGTKGPQMYNDSFYGTDLEVKVYGTFSIQTTDPEKLIKNFVPANISYYSFKDANTKAQITSEFMQSFIVALNSLSDKYRISQLPSQANEIENLVRNDTNNVGTWEERFGFILSSVAIENIEFSDESKELVKQYSSNKMNVKAYDDVSEKTSNIAAQQKIADGIRDNGLGDAGGMLFGMNMAQNLSPNAQLNNNSADFDKQIENLKKLKELLDAGILTQEEFEAKKKEIMGL